MRSGAACVVMGAVCWASLFVLIHLGFTTKLAPIFQSEFSHWQFYAKIAAAVIVTLLLARPVLNALENLLSLRQSQTSQDERGSGNWYLVAAAVFVVFVAQTIDALTGKIIEKAFFGAVITLAVVAFQVGVITLSWIAGVKSKPWRATAYGALAGGLTELFLQLLAIVIGASKVLDLSIVLQFFMIGLIGGLALDLISGSRPAARVAIAVAGAALTSAGAPLIIGGGFSLPLLVEACGWALGMLICPMSNQVFSKA